MLTRLLRVLALLLIAAFAPSAMASTTVDIRGDWAEQSHYGGTSSYVMHWTTEDFSSGAVSGTGGQPGNDQWSMTGTIDGSHLVFTETYYGGGYSSTEDVMVSADGNSYSGTFQDSNGTTGTITASRTSGPPSTPPPSQPPPGNTTKRSSATSILCNRGPQPTDDSVCTATVSDGGASPFVTPTGTVKWTAERGGFRSGDTCQLQPKPEATAFATCQVTYAPPPEGTPAGTRIPVSAAYQGDSAHDPSSATTTGLDPKQFICAGLWTLDCENVLPKPNPVRTCVGLWENCTGPSGKSKTFDVRGLPSSVSGSVSCAEQPTSTQKVTAAQVSEATRCLINASVNSTDPKVKKQAKDQVQYQLNAAQFASLVNDRKSALTQGIFQLSCQGTTEHECELFKGVALALISALTPQYDLWAEPGAPIRRGDVRLVDLVYCEDHFTGDDRTSCEAMIQTINTTITDDWKALAATKTQLGLDAPAPGTKKVAVAAKKKAKAPVALALGHVTITKGKRGKIRVKFPPKARKILRTLKRHGVKRVRAVATTRATIRPGVTRTKRTKIRIRLAR